MPQSVDVVVVGAGAAGLAAAVTVGRAGRTVAILEARNRIGGRILTHRDPACDVPIELGAEFIHGFAPETWKLLQSGNVSITEVEGDQWCFRNGRLDKCDLFSHVDRILNKMDRAAPDDSFLNFVNRCFPDREIDPELSEAKKWAIGYVSGFNAADPARVGVRWLVHEMQAEEKSEGDRAFRTANGYEDLLRILNDELSRAKIAVHTGSVVQSVEWRDGWVEIRASQNGSICKFTASRLVITLPLGVMQASLSDVGAVQFNPPLPERKRDAINKLEMGKVLRVVLRFRHRFWENIRAASGDSQTLSGMSFLFSQDPWFPTWWTTMPVKSPILIAWAAASRAEQMSGENDEALINRCLISLSRLLGFAVDELKHLLEAAYFHDWQRDPFSRGAYSYGPVDSEGAQAVLAEPEDNTLFFAGEATDTTGNNGTVHGALSSGYRAAREILSSLH